VLDACGAPAARWPTSRTTEVVEGIRLLAATEGVFAETAGGVTVATTASSSTRACSTRTPRP
jgi:threonine synthase